MRRPVGSRARRCAPAGTPTLRPCALISSGDISVSARRPSVLGAPLDRRVHRQDEAELLADAVSCGFGRGRLLCALALTLLAC